MKKLNLVALAAVLALFGAACSGGDDGGAITTPSSTAPASTADATVEGTALNKWDPDEVTIAAGETVQWTWGGSHNVVSKEGSTELDSGEVTPASSYEHQFDTAGTYEYFCEAHGISMSGTVIVT